MQARAKRAPKLRKIDIRVPVLQKRGAGCDTPLFDAVDRAVLRAVDGQSTVRAIAVATGRPDDVVARSIERLERLRVITFLTSDPRPAAEPPKRLVSGVRPALKTFPTGLDEVADGAGVHDRPTLAPPPDDQEMEVTIAEAEVDDLLEDDAEPEARLTLPGIGPRAASTPKR